MPTITDLLHRPVVFDGVCLKLDPESARGRVYNWRGVADYLHRNEYIDYEDYEGLDKCIGGGQNPVTEFLDALFAKFPNIMVSEFTEKARTLGREDIADLLEENENDSNELQCIKLSKRNKLEIYLDKYIPTEKTWRNFAEEYGFTLDQINLMNTRRTAPKKFSPTECLFEEIRKQNPLLDLGVILLALKSLHRMDVYNVIVEAFPLYNDGSFRVQVPRETEEEELDAVSINTRQEVQPSRKNNQAGRAQPDLLASVATGADEARENINESSSDKGNIQEPVGMVPIQESSQSVIKKKTDLQTTSPSTVFQVRLNKNKDGHAVSNSTPVNDKLNAPPNTSSTNFKQTPGITNHHSPSDTLTKMSEFSNGQTEANLCVIISNYDYQKYNKVLAIPRCTRATSDIKPVRLEKKHSKVDQMSIRTFFKPQQWDVVEYKNLTASEMMDVPGSISKGKYSYVVCIIMTYGIEDQICGTDYKIIGIHNFVDTFNKELQGIPKVILIQSTQQSAYTTNEDSIDSLCTDETIVQIISTKKKATYRKSMKGSWFIQGFVSSMKRNEHEKKKRLRDVMQGICSEVLQMKDYSDADARMEMKKLGKWNSNFSHDIKFA